METENSEDPTQKEPEDPQPFKEKVERGCGSSSQVSVKTLSPIPEECLETQVVVGLNQEREERTEQSRLDLEEELTDSNNPKEKVETDSNEEKGKRKENLTPERVDRALELKPDAPPFVPSSTPTNGSFVDPAILEVGEKPVPIPILSPTKEDSNQAEDGKRKEEPTKKVTFSQTQLEKSAGPTSERKFRDTIPLKLPTTKPATSQRGGNLGPWIGPSPRYMPPKTQFRQPRAPQKGWNQQPYPRQMIGMQPRPRGFNSYPPGSRYPPPTQQKGRGPNVPPQMPRGQRPALPEANHRKQKDQKSPTPRIGEAASSQQKSNPQPNQKIVQQPQQANGPANGQPGLKKLPIRKEESKPQVLNSQERFRKPPPPGNNGYPYTGPWGQIVRTPQPPTGLELFESKFLPSAGFPKRPQVGIPTPQGYQGNHLKTTQGQGEIKKGIHQTSAPSYSSTKPKKKEGYSRAVGLGGKPSTSASSTHTRWVQSEGKSGKTNFEALPTQLEEGRNRGKHGITVGGATSTGNDSGPKPSDVWDEKEWLKTVDLSVPPPGMTPMMIPDATGDYSKVTKNHPTPVPPSQEAILSMSGPLMVPLPPQEWLCPEIDPTIWPQAGRADGTGGVFQFYHPRQRGSCYTIVSTNSSGEGNEKIGHPPVGENNNISSLYEFPTLQIENAVYSTAVEGMQMLPPGLQFDPKVVEAATQGVIRAQGESQQITSDESLATNASLWKGTQEQLSSQQSYNEVANLSQLLPTKVASQAAPSQSLLTETTSQTWPPASEEASESSKSSEVKPRAGKGGATASAETGEGVPGQFKRELYPAHQAPAYHKGQTEQPFLDTTLTWDETKKVKHIESHYRLFTPIAVYPGSQVYSEETRRAKWWRLEPTAKQPGSTRKRLLFHFAVSRGLFTQLNCVVQARLSSQYKAFSWVGVLAEFLKPIRLHQTRTPGQIVEILVQDEKTNFDNLRTLYGSLLLVGVHLVLKDGPHDQYLLELYKQVVLSYRKEHLTKGDHFFLHNLGRDPLYPPYLELSCIETAEGSLVFEIRVDLQTYLPLQ